jgi:hypothetical protein
MTTPAEDYGALLRGAIKKAREEAPKVVDDLIRLSSNAAAAVADVTKGLAALEMSPQEKPKDSPAVFQLTFRKVKSDAPPTDLGIYRVTEAGYPVVRWFTKGRWEAAPAAPDETFMNPGSMEGHFKWLISNPQSRVVVLVAYFLEQAKP